MSQENVEIVRTVLQGVQAGMARGDLGAAFDLGVEAGVMACSASSSPTRTVRASW